MRYWLLAPLVLLVLAGCGDTPPTATPAPVPTPTPPAVVSSPTPTGLAPAEAAYVRAARAQVGQYQAQLARLSAAADTPGPDSTQQAQTAQVVAVVQAWAKDALRLTAPPRFATAQQQYLAALQHLVTGTALLRDAQATPGGTSTLDAPAQAELGQAGPALQAFLNALPAGTP